MNEPLLDRTVRLLDACELSPIDIARRANVGFEWLRKFQAGRIKDPSVRRVQRLHDFLIVVVKTKPLPSSCRSSSPQIA
jgi:hypothetical protein